VARAHRRGTRDPLGDVVGYKVRFQRPVAARRLVKLMTDGILLAETQTDPLLHAYDTRHHRRGARAQPEHRLPAGLPAQAAAAPART
jgi:hypothetical protein